MEITIKLNDYVKPTEVRQWVVQALVDIYLQFRNDDFCPNNCWRQTHSIGKNEYGKWDLVKNHMRREFTEVTKIRTCEMKEFFRIWQQAGYYIHKTTYTVRNSTAILYYFHKTPNYYDCRLVSEFTEDID